MPTLQNRKRRAPAAEEEEDDYSSEASAAPRTQQRKTSSKHPQPTTQRTSPSPSPDLTDPTTTHTSSSNPSTKLIRLALSTSLTRTPLRRADINQKCATTPQNFKRTFAEADVSLKQVFGMALTELPGREKVTLRERQKEAATQTHTQRGGEGGTNKEEGGGGQKQWILTSTLPPSYREIIGRYSITPAASTGNVATPAELESAYTALTSTLILLITLSGGSLSQQRLERHLKRLNAETSTPVDPTEKTLQRMVRESYIVRVKEGAAGEEPSIEYRVGPRGKVEVGGSGVAAMVRRVYTDVEAGSESARELEGRIARSLRGAGLSDNAPALNGVAGGGGGGGGEVSGDAEVHGAPVMAETARRTTRGEARRTRPRADEDEDD